MGCETNSGMSPGEWVGDGGEAELGRLGALQPVQRLCCRAVRHLLRERILFLEKGGGGGSQQWGRRRKNLVKEEGQFAWLLSTCIVRGRKEAGRPCPADRLLLLHPKRASITSDRKRAESHTARTKPPSSARPGELRHSGERCEAPRIALCNAPCLGQAAPSQLQPTPEPGGHRGSTAALPAAPLPIFAQRSPVPSYGVWPRPCAHPGVLCQLLNS